MDKDSDHSFDQALLDSFFLCVFFLKLQSPYKSNFYVLKKKSQI